MKALNNKELRRIANGNGPTEIRWAAIKELQSRPAPTHALRDAILVGLLCIGGVLLADRADAAQPVHMVCDGQQVTVTDTAIVVDGWRYANPVPVNGDQPVNVDIKAFADSNHNVAMVVDVADQTYLQTGPEHVAVCRGK